jgi:hypothetical protein
MGSTWVARKVGAALAAIERERPALFKGRHFEAAIIIFAYLMRRIFLCGLSLLRARIHVILSAGLAA